MKRTTVGMLFGAALLAIPTVLAPATARAQAADETRNEATFLAMVEAINDRDLDRLDDLVAADVVRRSPSTPGVVVESLDDFKAFLRADFAAVPDSEIECPVVIVEDERLASWCTYEGHQEGPLGPFPGNGEPLALEYAGYMVFDDSGRIAEVNVVWDNLDVLTQLGHFPPPGAEGDGMWEGEEP